MENNIKNFLDGLIAEERRIIKEELVYTKPDVVILRNKSVNFYQQLVNHYKDYNKFTQATVVLLCEPAFDKPDVTFIKYGSNLSMSSVDKDGKFNLVFQEETQEDKVYSYNLDNTGNKV